MLSLAQDELYMQRALALASETVALASPNPQVGCVLVRDDQILGEGAHLYENYDHAEIVALKDAAAKGHDSAGATAYVTLEPCSHHGRTGPCADALIAAGVARVVIATEDPNPQVSGQGIAKLQAAGIEAVVGLYQREARDLIEPFAHFIRKRTPFVTLKAALSADGKLAPHPSTRTLAEPFWLTGAEARADVQQLRHAADAVLTGIGTVLADDPALTDRTGLPRRRPLLRIILDTHLRIPPTSQLLRAAANDLLLVCGSSAPTERIAAFAAAGIELAVLPGDQDGKLSLPTILAMLGRRNVLNLLLECGSQLNGAFLQQCLVDKIVFFHAAVELGSEALPFAQGIASPTVIEQSLARTNHATFGPDIRITGYLHDPWASS